MTGKGTVSMFDQGVAIHGGIVTDVKSLPWNEHPAFKGVYLKHLIKGEATGGTFSAHLVKIMAGCEIGDHVHEDKYELHEVIEGAGTGIVDGKPFAYVPGVMAVMPEGVKHRVIAGEKDMYLLAKFVPPLL